MNTSPAHQPHSVQDSVLRLLDAQTRLIESACADLRESTPLDLTQIYGMDPRDLGIGDHPAFYQASPVWQGMALMDRQKHGEFIPAFLTEPQLRWYRRRIRALCVNSEVALNIINTRISYAVGDGLKFEAVSKDPDRPDDRIIDDAQAVIDAFVEHNQLELMEAEAQMRMDIDGEAFIRAFPTQSGILTLRFIEPEYIQSPTGDSDENSFGIQSDKDDVNTIKGYWVMPDLGQSPELLDPEEVAHLKHPDTPSTSKRGLSAFFPVEGSLRMVEDLLTSTVSLAKTRAKIALIRKLAGTSGALAQSLLNNLAVASGNDPGTNTTVNVERLRYGTILTVPETMDVEMPSANVNAGDHAAVLQMVLRVIGTRFAFPEYLVSGDASNANFASTMVSESPFVKAMERLQAYLIRFWGKNRYGAKRALVWRQLAHAVKHGLLSPEVFRKVDIQTVAPTLVVRDVQKEAQVDNIYHQMGAKSIKTIQMEQGLDPDIEARNFEEEQKKQQAQEQQGQEGGGDAEGGNPLQGLFGEHLKLHLPGELTEEIRRTTTASGAEYCYDTELKKRVSCKTGDQGKGAAKSKPDDKPSPAEKKPTAAKAKAPAKAKKEPAPKKIKADPEELASRIKAMQGKGKATAEDIAGVAEELMGLTVAQLNGLKKTLGLSASGAKEALAKSIAKKALSGEPEKTPAAEKTPAPRKKPERYLAPSVDSLVDIQDQKEFDEMVKDIVSRPKADLIAVGEQWGLTQNLRNKTAKALADILTRFATTARTLHIRANVDAPPAAPSAPPAVTSSPKAATATPAPPPPAVPPAPPPPAPAPPPTKDKAKTTVEPYRAPSVDSLVDIQDQKEFDEMVKDIVSRPKADLIAVGEQWGLTQNLRNKTAKELADILAGHATVARTLHIRANIDLRPQDATEPKKKPDEGSKTPKAKPSPASSSEHLSTVAGEILNATGPVSLVDLAKNTGLTVPEMHAALQSLRKQGLVSMEAAEGHKGLTPEQSKHAIKDGNDHLLYVSARDGAEKGLKGLVGKGENKPSPAKQHPTITPGSPLYDKRNASLPDAARPVLSEDESSAITEYTSLAYRSINKALRRGETPPSDHEDGNLSDIHDRLQKAFAKATPFAEPVTVHRGLVFNPATAGLFDKYIEQCKESLEKGTTIDAVCYQSTTADESKARGVDDSRHAGNKRTVKLKIAARKGLDARPYSGYPDEAELLLDHTSKFKVTGIKVDPKSGGYDIEIAQVLDDDK